VTKIFNAE